MWKAHRKKWIAAVAVVVLAWLACRGVARVARGEPEWRVLHHQPADYGLAARRVDVTSRDHLRVAAWWIAAHPDRPGRATVILVHGRGGNRGSMLARAKFLVAAGYDALPIDTRASGDSEGDYPSPGCREVAEIDAAVDLAGQTSPRPVVLLGYSVGGVAVLHATSDGARVAATIADSPFITAFDVFERFGDQLRSDGGSLGARIGLWFLARRSLAGVGSWMLRIGGADDIDPRCADLLPVLPRVAVPVLFLSGTSDPISPTANAHEMADAVHSPGSRLVELPADHRTYEQATAGYEHAVLEFLAAVVPDAPS